MSSIDQSRAYLALREQITALHEEFGPDVAWWIVESAVRANIQRNKILVHKVSKTQLKSVLSRKNSGEIA